MKNFCEDLFFFGDRLKNFCGDLFFCACVLGPWPWPRAFLSLASRVSVLGKAVPGLGFFFVSLALASSLMSSTPPLASSQAGPFVLLLKCDVSPHKNQPVCYWLFPLLFAICIIANLLTFLLGVLPACCLRISLFLT